MVNRRFQQLAAASRDRQLVRFSRRFEDSRVRGYVLDIGPKFFLLAVVNDRIWLDGFECIRIVDVRDQKPDSNAEFAEAALRIRGERLPKKPRVKLASIKELVLSASRAFPLVTIHCEQVDPDVCRIGRVLGVERGCVSLLEITPAAKWDREPTSYPLSDVTRVDFGGDYENALTLVGGEPATR